MALAPADFAAYSRATGAPYPEDSEEMAQMAPAVAEFRRNQLKAPRQESNPLAALGAAALGAGALAGAFFGARHLLKAPQEVRQAGRKLTDLPSAEAALNTAARYKPADATPPPSKPAIPQATVDLAELQKPKEPATLLGFLQDVQEQENFRGIPRPATQYRPGSIADRVTKEQQQRVQSEVDGNNPETQTYVSKLNERRQVRAAQAQELADKVKNALISGGEQQAYDLSTPQIDAVGSTAASAFAEAKEREQQRKPAPVTKSWQDKLFDERGMLRSDVIAMHLGDENVIPKNIAEELIASAEVDRRGNILGFTNSPAIFQATKHVRENLLAHDYQNSIKNYLAGEEPGDLQAAQSRGYGWSAKSTAPTDVITVQTNEGETPKISVARRSSAKYDISDLEPLFLDPETKTLVRKADIGSSGTPDAESGTGIGEEIGQAVAFVPREELSSFVSTPGVSGSGTEQYKNQGAGYAIGGVKEFGGSSGAGYKAQDPSLPVLSVDEHISNKNIGVSSNGNLYAKVKPIALTGDPRLSKRLNQDYGNTFYRHPVTNKPWNSAEEAAAFINQVHEQFNENQLAKIQSQMETKELYRGPMEAALVGRDPEGRQRKTWLDPYQKLSDIGEATLSSQIQSMLLQKGVIQEAQTEEGGKYLRQTRYSVPDVIDGNETKAWVLGPEHSGVFPTTTDQGKRNHYEYLQAVQKAYQEITGNALADIDVALTLRQQKVGPYLGGPNSNPYLNKALTVANTLTQVAEPTRQRALEPGSNEGLGERYGLGATVSARPSRTIPSRQKTVPLVSASFEPVYEWNEEKGMMEYLGEQAKYSTTTKELHPSEIGGKRLAAALVDYRERSGRPMRRTDFLQFASSIAQQEGADINDVIKQASAFSRGAGQQAVIGRTMQQGRRGLSAMDRLSPAEEVAQTVAEYDFGETIGSDIEELTQRSQMPRPFDKELAARQSQRAKVEPMGSTETFGVNEQMLSGLMGKLRAQADRRAGKHRNRYS
jgi:hypothetical protein